MPDSLFKYTHFYDKDAMKIMLIIITAIFPIVLKASGEASNIVIQGKIDSSITHRFNTRTLLIKLHDPSQELIGKEEMVKVFIDDRGAFKTTIKPSSNLTYLSFWVIHNNRRIGDMVPIHFPARDGLVEPYLFEYSDSVSIFIGKDGYMKFKGQGAEKLNCQYQIYSLQPRVKAIDSRKQELLSQAYFNEALLLEKNALDLLIKVRLDLLNTYKRTLKKEIYELIFLDLISSARYKIISQFWNAVYYSPTAKLNECLKAMQDSFKSLYQNDELLKVDSSTKLKSLWYCDYLFEKEWNNYKLYSNNIAMGDSFKVIYDILSKKYTGSLRDRLLFIGIRKLNIKFRDQVDSILGSALAKVEEVAFKRALKVFKDRQESQAYPFEFQDAAGEIHTLNKYAGKTIVIDFWFTGCNPCMKLNAAMRIIIDQYKDNKNIVFLTVSEDRNREQWLKSVASGKYTSPGTIDLYTNGLGAEHKMLKYYGFTGAPQQIIIDKKGKIVSLAPPRTDTNLIYHTNTNTGNIEMDAQDVLTSSYTKEFMNILDKLIDNTAR